MNNIWTKIGAGGVSLISGLLLTSAVLAADASNSNTGAESNNEATVSISNDTTINSTNNSTITNTLNVKANTGNNSANQNTGDGTVSSGDINGSITLLNTGNTNGDLDSLLNLNCSSNCNFSASNNHTGAGSNNESSVDANNDVNVTLNNSANVNNGIGANLDTGNNSADGNTGDGIVMTGDINFSINVTNDLNHNGQGGPLPGPGGDEPPTSILPTPGQVLAAAKGLPITGGALPSWPLMLIAIGFGLKLLEKVFGRDFASEEA